MFSIFKRQKKTIEPTIPMRKGYDLALKMLRSATCFDGKRILEIGADSSLILPKVMLDEGASSVLVSNIDGRLKEVPTDERLSVQRANALNLPETFGKEQFDIIFGTAILEHIPYTSDLLVSMHEALRPGGIGLLTGGPIWSSPKGHHLWAKTSLGLKKFSDEDCPVEPWSHLVLSEDEMREVLNCKDAFTEDDLDKMLHWIYRAKGVNRYPENYLKDCFNNSSFEILEIQQDKSTYDGRYLDSAQEILGPNTNVFVTNVRYLLRKN